MVNRPLEQVLADWREDAQILRKHGHTCEADQIEKLSQDVAVALDEYLKWVSEEDAMLRSSRSREWLRSQFPEWERLGHARRDGRRRTYRLMIIPMRANLTAAAAAGREAARAS